jgi:hypothetical protein
MNRVAIEGGGISRVLPIGEIGSDIIRILSR